MEQCCLQQARPEEKLIIVYHTLNCRDSLLLIDYVLKTSVLDRDLTVTFNTCVGRSSSKLLGATSLGSGGYSYIVTERFVALKLYVHAFPISRTLP